jgi:hypothetical protein
MLSQTNLDSEQLPDHLGLVSDLEVDLSHPDPQVLEQPNNL